MLMLSSLDSYMETLRSKDITEDMVTFGGLSRVGETEGERKDSFL